MRAGLPGRAGACSQIDRAVQLCCVSGIREGFPPHHLPFPHGHHEQGGEQHAPEGEQAQSGYDAPVQMGPHPGLLPLQALHLPGGHAVRVHSDVPGDRVGYGDQGDAGDQAGHGDDEAVIHRLPRGFRGEVVIGQQVKFRDVLLLLIQHQLLLLLIQFTWGALTQSAGWWTCLHQLDILLLLLFLLLLLSLPVFARERRLRLLLGTRGAPGLCPGCWTLRSAGMERLSPAAAAQLVGTSGGVSRLGLIKVKQFEMSHLSIRMGLRLWQAHVPVSVRDTMQRKRHVQTVSCTQTTLCPSLKYLHRQDPLGASPGCTASIKVQLIKHLRPLLSPTHTNRPTR